MERIIAVDTFLFLLFVGLLTLVGIQAWKYYVERKTKKGGEKK